MKIPKITKIRVHAYQWEVQDLGVDYNGFNQVYEPGARRKSTGHVIAIETDPDRTTAEGGWWWDVAVPEVSPRANVREARERYERERKAQRP